MRLNADVAHVRKVWLMRLNADNVAHALKYGRRFLP